MKRMYLDLCCYKRPFDDQRDERIRDEAGAVASIMDRVGSGEVELVRSPALRVENERNPREDRRIAAALWLDGAAIDVDLTDAIEERARELCEMGFRPLDAFHVAFAEAAGAECLVTCDEAFRNLAKRRRSELHIDVTFPEEALGKIRR
jgi:predicted nucleic acid-binding protein